MRSLTRLILACCLLFCQAALARNGNPYNNVGSPLGINLSGIGATSTEQPFLNILKSGGGWGVTGGSGLTADMQVDIDGYPTTMALANGGGTATKFALVMMFALPPSNNFSVFPERAGHYVLLYSGTCTISLGQDAVTLISSVTGRQVWNVPASSATFVSLNITAIPGAGTYCSNIAVIYSPASDGSTVGAQEQAYLNGEIFDPVLFNLISRNSSFRFMDWQDTLNSLTANWVDRTHPSYIIYGHNPGDGFGSDTKNVGVPVEVMVALCNKAHADCYFNMPAAASDDYMTQFATLVHSTLNANLKARVEDVNECWNPSNMSNAVQTYLEGQGFAVFPGLTPGDNTGAIIDYCAFRTTQMSALWRTAWGSDSGRVVIVLGGQAGFEGRNSAIMGLTAGTSGSNPALWTGTVASHADALATAPYFGDQCPISWTADSDGGLTRCFAELTTGLIPAASQATTSGGPAAFTATVSGVLASPANGTCIAVTLNQNGTSGQTLAVSGGSALEMTDFYGNAIAYGAGLLPLCFTNATTIVLNFTGISGGAFIPGSTVTGGTSGAKGTIILSNENTGGGGPLSVSSITGTFSSGETITSGAVSATVASIIGGAVSPAQWRSAGAFGYAGGRIKQVIDQFTSNAANAASFGLVGISYEGGQAFFPGGVTTIMSNWDIAINRDIRMYSAYMQYLNGMKTSGGQLFQQYNDVSQPGNFGLWGAMENSVQPPTPKQNALTDFTQWNHCWWLNCNINFLLKRDLDPANDNTPMFLNEVA